MDHLALATMNPRDEYLAGGITCSILETRLLDTPVKMDGKKRTQLPSLCFQKNDHNKSGRTDLPTKQISTDCLPPAFSCNRRRHLVQKIPVLIDVSHSVRTHVIVVTFPGVKLRFQPSNQLPC